MKNIVVSTQATHKKAYTAPWIEVVADAAPVVLYEATITQGGDDDGTLPIQAPKHELDIEFRDVWEE